LSGSILESKIYLSTQVQLENDVELNEYQREAAKTAVYPRVGDNVVYPILGLVSEAGEVSGKLKKLIRDGTPGEDFRLAVAKELGDCQWYIAQICTELELTLEQIANLNLMKLRHRNDHGTLNGSGDDR
jgi:NTP pyrophosphatase (non-canonical NTP hydrolase)